MRVLGLIILIPIELHLLFQPYYLWWDLKKFATTKSETVKMPLDVRIIHIATVIIDIVAIIVYLNTGSDISLTIIIIAVTGGPSYITTEYRKEKKKIRLG